MNTEQSYFYEMNFPNFFVNIFQKNKKFSLFTFFFPSDSYEKHSIHIVSSYIKRKNVNHSWEQNTFFLTCPLRFSVSYITYSSFASFSFTTDYSDYSDYFNKTSHWRAWLNDFSDIFLIRLIRLIIVFFNEKSVFIW